MQQPLKSQKNLNQNYQQQQSCAQDQQESQVAVALQIAERFVQKSDVGQYLPAWPDIDRDLRAVIQFENNLTGPQTKLDRPAERTE